LSFVGVRGPPKKKERANFLCDVTQCDGVPHTMMTSPMADKREGGAAAPSPMPAPATDGAVPAAVPSTMASSVPQGSPAAAGDNGSRNLQATLDLLRSARRDEERFVAMMVLVKLVDATDAAAVRAVHEHMPFPWLHKLLVAGTANRPLATAGGLLC